jgi:DEAD/DEAH box helicase domain-containing protein
MEEPNTAPSTFFPTKALAQDQLRKLKELFSPGLVAPQTLATFDGDTPAPSAAMSRNTAASILTNRICSTWASCPATSPGLRCSAT